MQLITSLLMLLVWAYSSVLIADETAANKYRNYTPQQISNLPEKELSSSVPIVYTSAASMALSKGSDLLFAMQLNSLMYSGVNDYENSVKSFQVDIGEAPTGILTVGQISDLDNRSSLQKMTTVTFPDTYISKKTDTYAMVNGTMMIHDDRINWPVNYVELTCYKLEKYCELRRLNLVFPDEKSWDKTYSVLQEDPVLYNITKWTNDIVDATPSDPSSECRISALNLNFKTKEFYEITRNGTGECEAMGIKIPRLKSPRIAQIVDGKEIFSKEFSTLRDKAFSVLSSSFTSRVKSLAAEKK